MRHFLPYIYLLVFVIGCYILLPIMNHDYLFALQEHSLWVKGHTFMTETISDHGGWVAYIGAYLTQYFYYPWLGSSILIAFWVIIYFLCQKACRFSGKLSFIPFLPLLLLPAEVLSLGYHIYDSKCVGFAFITTIYIVIFAVCIFVISLFLRRFKTKDAQLAKQCFVIVLLILAILSLNSTPSYRGLSTTFFDRNFHHELRMYQAADECRWEDVLSEAPTMLGENHEKPTNLMIMLRNIALLNTDKLMDNTFEYDNCGTIPATNDSVKVKMSLQAGPMLYYLYGMVNYANRWAIENSVKYYLNIDNLKMLVRCAIMNQEFDVAMKYINILKSTTFYRKWAKEREAMLIDNRLLIQTEEYNCIAPLVPYNDELDIDDSNVEQYILDYYSNFNSSEQVIQELSIASSLLLQHEEEFMIHFYNFAQRHPDTPAPKSMQEAAYLIGPTELSPIDVSQYPFDNNIKASFAQFNTDYHTYKSQNMSDADIAEKMRPLYGTTYWWYYYFNPELKFY